MISNSSQAAPIQPAIGETIQETGTGRSIAVFFLLVLLLSIPLWAVAQLTGVQLVPGLPLSALQAFVPVVAAGIVVGGTRGRRSVTALLKRSLDFRRVQGRHWFLVALLLMPLVMLAGWAVLPLTGTALPPPQFSIIGEVALFAAFFVAAEGEELGWSGFALEPMQAWWGPSLAAMALGMFWAGWHVIPDLQAGRGLAWVIWQFVGTVALRVIMVWLFDNSGKSVFLMVIFHTMINVSEFPFSNYGPLYNPFVPTLILIALAAAVATGFGLKFRERRAKSAESVGMHFPEP